jgi:hypothetical protein
MASSVSSESAFSAAGITISKRRNRLGGDIVEALQCLKSFIHQDLIFRESCQCCTRGRGPRLSRSGSSQVANHEANTSEVVHDGEDWSWDKLVEGLEDEEQSRALTLTI